VDNFHICIDSEISYYIVPFSALVIMRLFVLLFVI